MANVKFPRSEIEKELKLNKINIEKISLLGTPLEYIDDNEIEIEIFPNRPDMLSMQGWLRAFKTFIGKEKGLKKYKVNSPEKNYKVVVDKSVKSIRPYTACAIVKGIKFDDEKIKEIIDLQEKLHNTVGRNRKKLAIGIYPLEKIKLPIKYEARKPEDISFMPLEMDREMNGLQILQRHPTGREYAHLLEDKNKYPIFVDAAGKILSMPPIINSHETGKVSEETKEIFVECSGFDLETLEKTLNIIVTTLADMGGKIYAMDVKYNKKITTLNLKPEKIKISLEKINELLGLNLKEKDLEKLLPKMGYDYKKGNVSVPAWRTDILHEVDIAEDVAIAYGYDKFNPEIPKLATTGKEAKEAKISSKISEILIGLGLNEISTYHLIKMKEAKTEKIENKIELEDSKTEYKILRPNLKISALRTLSENKDNEYPQKIFEIGTVFKKNEKEETGIEENENLVIAITPSNFTEIKQILDYLTRMLNITYSLEESTEKGLIEGRTGKIMFEKEVIGYIGEMHPTTLKNWSIKMPVAILEISLTKIFDTF